MQVPVLGQVVRALREGADDPHVAGVVAHVGGGTVPSLAQADELRAAVAVFRASGKPTWCWSETYGEVGPGNVAFLLATAFDEIWLQPSGDVGLTGVVAEALSLREGLDKLGVVPQFGQRHEYKSAADLFMQSHMTEPHRTVLERMTESTTAHVVEEVAAARHLTPVEVRAAIDGAPLAAEVARELRLVDRLGYRDDVYAAIRAEVGGDVSFTFAHRYRRRPSVRQLPARMKRGRPVIAVVTARGPIHLGRSGRSPLAGASIGSDTVGAALRSVADHDDVRAVVLRVDSQGGSYVASDAIRREVGVLRQTGRPVVASMGSVAASGGYYIAMPADVVVANPGTVTGSIGVLAGKLVTRDAVEKLGVRRESVSVGRYAEMLSPLRPFTDEEWARLDDWLDRVYADFVGKAAADRGMGVDDLDEVARGRVWTGRDAAERGLVDELGGLDRAVDVACARAGVARADADVRVLPRPNLLERVRPAENSDHVGAVGTVGTVGTLRAAGAAVGAVGAAGAVGVLGGSGAGELEPRLLTMLGLAPYGVLSLPVRYRFR